MPSDNLIPISTAGVRRNFFLRSSTTGLGLTGKTYADFTGSRSANGAIATSLSFASGSAGDAYSSGKIAEIGGGRYCWHIPDAIFATLGSSTAWLAVTGGITVNFEWEVVVVDRGTSAFGANTVTPERTRVQY